MTNIDMIFDTFINNKNVWFTNNDINNRLPKRITPAMIRHYISVLRDSGHLIIANHKGYKLSTNKEEINEYLKVRLMELDKEYKQIMKMGVENERKNNLKKI